MRQRVTSQRDWGGHHWGGDIWTDAWMMRWFRVEPAGAKDLEMLINLACLRAEGSVAGA